MSFSRSNKKISDLVNEALALLPEMTDEQLTILADMAGYELQDRSYDILDNYPEDDDLEGLDIDNDE